MRFFLERLLERNEPMFWFGLICLIGVAICMILIRTTETEVLGINAWIKPMKFLLSSVILSWSMAWYMDYLDMPESVSAASWVIIISLGLELIYIMVQANRGVLSHFNLNTPIESFMWSFMAIAATFISLAVAYVAVLFFSRDFPDLPNYYVWSIRLGLILFVIFSFQGFTMGARMAHTIGAPDGGAGIPILNWSLSQGDLRVAHFFGMHAMQVIPILSYYVLRNLKLTILLSIAYGLLALFTWIQALQGKPFIKG